MLSTARCILLVTPLEECTKRGADTLLPYSLLKYEFAGRFENVTYQMIDPDTILRPCILVRDADRKWNFLSIGRRCLAMVRYWGIRYSTTDRGIGYGSLADENADSSHEQQRPFVLGNSTIQAIYETRRQESLHGDEIEYEADNGFELSEDEEGDEAT
jgi:hypothetical protein